MAQASSRAKPSPIRYLYATVTQGSNDAFAETEIPTGLSSLANFAYRIREILWEFTGTFGCVNGGQYELALTHTTQADEPTISDRPLIDKKKYRITLTTSGAVRNDQMLQTQYSSEDNVLVVTESIFAQIDTDSTSATNSVRVRIGYEVVEIGELDRLNLLNAVSLGF